MWEIGVPNFKDNSLYRKELIKVLNAFLVNNRMARAPNNQSLSSMPSWKGNTLTYSILRQSCGEIGVPDYSRKI